MKWLKQLFCKHYWVKRYIGAYDYDYLECNRCYKHIEIDEIKEDL